MERFVVALAGLVLLVSCNSQKVLNMGDSPLIVVIKLNSAESLNNREEARKHIDVQSVYDPKKYSNEAGKKSPSAEEIYEEYLNFIGSLKRDKKFSSEFPYHYYNIKEIVKDDIAEVIFSPKNNEAKYVQFGLTLVNGQWVVTSIRRGK